MHERQLHNALDGDEQIHQWGSTFNPTRLTVTRCLPHHFDSPVVSPTHPQTVFLGTTRLWASTNSGATWNTISPQLDTNPPFGGTCASPSDSGCPVITNVVVGPSADNDVIVEYQDGQAFITTNSGSSWNPIAPLCSGVAGCADSAVEYAISPASPLLIYAVGSAFSNTTFTSYSGVFTSTNGGASWSLLPSSSTLPNITAAQIAISPANRHLIVITINGAAFISTDDGADWSNVGGLPNVPSIASSSVTMAVS